MNYTTYRKNIEGRNKRLITNLSKTVKSKVVSFDKYELIINPGVFDPSLGEGSQIMAKIKHLFVGEDVLEIGTGSGALAILAAENANKVVATDISQEAINCANENFLKYNLNNKIELRKGDLFSVIDESEKFDVIIFNPPFLNGTPETILSRSYFDDCYTTLDTFISNAKRFLKEKGKIYICFGGVGDVGYLDFLIIQSRMDKSITCSQIINSLLFFIYEITSDYE